MMKTLIDNVYWDDLVLNIEKNDTGWFTPNMSLVAAAFFDYYLVSNSRFVAVRQESGKTIHSEINIPKGLLESLKQSRTAHFFITTADGLMEACAGSIHPSDDLKLKKTQPYGYLVLMKKWDQKYLDHLATIIGSEIEIKTSPDSIVWDKSSAIQAKIMLTGWDGLAVAELISNRDLNLNFHVTQYIFYIIIAFVLLILFLFNFMSRIWIYKPLKLVTDVLKTDNHQSIDQLKKTPAEYGHIGDLFEAYVTQKQELIEAKEKAEESDRLKSSFLSSMSHEIRTPMNSIIGFSELLKDEEDCDKMQKYISFIQNSGCNLLLLINDLIDLSKIEAGIFSISYETFNLKEMFAELEETYNFELEKREKPMVKLHISHPAGDFMILSDPIRIQQALSNLLTNAVKFTTVGSVSLSYHKENDELIFTVADTGTGIPIEDQQKIFERFTRFDYQWLNTEGSGIGLSIVEKIAFMLKGRIWLKSVIGEGSSFFFSIPFNDSVAYVPPAIKTKTPNCYECK
ncbi:MAG: ATP-binding protein [Bacteroidota bacterium]|nr:ATP-binding protein [Bacteroidota bacterium]